MAVFYIKGDIMSWLSKKLGKRIKEIREGFNLKQYEFAEQLEMEPSNLTRIESGYQMPKEENLIKIAEKLGVKIKDLFDFNETFYKDEMIQKIVLLLKKSTESEIKYIYQMLINLKQLK